MGAGSGAGRGAETWTVPAAREDSEGLIVKKDRAAAGLYGGGRNYVFQLCCDKKLFREKKKREKFLSDNSCIQAMAIRSCASVLHKHRDLFKVPCAGKACFGAGGVVLLAIVAMWKGGVANPVVNSFGAGFWFPARTTCPSLLHYNHFLTPQI